MLNMEICMKKKNFILGLLILIMLLGGCNSKIQLPDNPIVFETKENDGYKSILWNDKEYVPYCPLESSQIGMCLGYYEENNELIYVCELKGLSSEEWIVDTLGLRICNEGMVLREVNTTNIPDGLFSDYDWN